MWRLILAGIALLVTGAARFHHQLQMAGHRPSLEDYLSFRCGTDAVTNLAGGEVDMPALMLHCWGCYAMTAGLALVTLAMMCRRLPAARLAARRG
jgi:hypothetical protein